MTAVLITYAFHLQSHPQTEADQQPDPHQGKYDLISPQDFPSAADIFFRTCADAFLTLETVPCRFPGSILRQSDIRRAFTGAARAAFYAVLPVPAQCK